MMPAVGDEHHLMPNDSHLTAFDCLILIQGVFFKLTRFRDDFTFLPLQVANEQPWS